MAHLKVALLCGLFTLVSHIPDASAQTLPTDLTPSLGLQYLDPGPKKTREIAKEELKSIILKRLAQLQGWPGEYASLKQHKAVAIKYSAPFPNPFIPRSYRPDYLHPHVSYWGGGWEFDTLEDAKGEALRNCGAECIPFLENDAVVIPTNILDEYIESRSKYIAKELEQLESAERVVLIDRASVELAKTRDSAQGLSLRVPMPQALFVGNPDRQQDYSDVCQDRVLYPLVRTPPASKTTALERLDALVAASFYGEYRRTINTKLQYEQPKEDERWERMSRYVVRLDINGEQLKLDQLRLPKYLSDALKGRRVETIWLEGSVRVTKDGLPLIPSDGLAPLAAQIDGELYFGVLLRLPDDKGRCYVSKPFSGKVLDLSACVNNLACAKRALDALQLALRSTFSTEPFLSTAIVNEDFAPGEFGMKRVREPSLLIGGPAYEISTYTFQTWSADSDNPFYSLYLRQQFAGVNDRTVALSPKDLSLFLKVTHVFTTSIHRNGTYAEPDTNEISRVEKVVSEAVRKVVRQVCSTIGGVMRSEICSTR